jgi:hypothetical protein
MVAACGLSDDDDVTDLGDAAGADAPIDGLRDAGLRVLRVDFDDAAGAWPAGWWPLGGVAEATVVAGRGRLVPSPSGYTLARMGHDLFPVSHDVEASFSFEMHDVARQGVGFYLRQNGGYLRQTAPTGAGYAVFVEGFAGNYLGVWRERDGDEEVLMRTAIPPLENGVSYTVRFRVEQQGDTTWLRAGLGPGTGWMIEHADSTPGLQHLDGGVAVDAWNTVIGGGQPAPAPVFIDEIYVRPWPT